MDKKQLETFIKKQHLGGTINSARWVCKDNTLKAVIMSEDKKLLTSVEMEKFDGLPETELGVLDISKLKQMINVVGPTMNLHLEIDPADSKRVTSLVISDFNATSNYVTADLDVMAGAPKLKAVPSYDVEIKFTEQLSETYLKAKSALPDVKLFTLIMSKKGKLEMVLGYSGAMNNNRIALQVQPEAGKDTVKEPISFSAVALKEILSANSECVDPVLKVSEQGLAFMEFGKDGFKSQYYMIKIDLED